MKLPSSAATPGLLSNLMARVWALGALAIGTFVVARAGGAAAVGVYALMRVLPSLVGVIISAGLPGAVTYFLAGESRSDPRLKSTIIAMAIISGMGGAIVWVLAAPLLERTFFDGVGADLLAWGGIMVFTHLLVATAKSCSQGSGDLASANRVIVLEELLFLPAFALVYWAGFRGYEAILIGLIAGDAAAAALSWTQLLKAGFIAGSSPSLRLARTVASYGARAQVGGLLVLLNLRLDFLLLGALTGPAVLGIYSVASKFAELLRLLPLSATYVLYPKYAREGSATAAAEARRLLPRMGGTTLVAAVPLALSAGFLLPTVYGGEFEAAIVPAQILLLGLAGEGVSSVVTAYLYGSGRPGLNSMAMGAGLAITIVLDLLLIPPFGAAGAAVASSAAYLAVMSVLLILFFRLTRSSEIESARLVGSLS
jgi:O-antigen/teichoic acid export membrane protein